MRSALTTLALTLIATGFISLGGCTCGFDCSSDDDNGGGGGNTPDTSLLSLSLSDALPEELEEVVIEISSVTLTRSDGDDVVIDTFIDPADPNNPALNTVPIDLLAYRGTAKYTFADKLEVEVADYNDIVIEVISGDVNNSYVQEIEGERFPLEVTNGSLNLDGVRVSEDEKAYVVEFELARALDFEVDNEVYRLSTDGIRVVDESDFATLTGSVEEEVFDTEIVCEEKLDPLKGNRLYLYEGHDISGSLGDVNRDPSAGTAPFAVATLQLSESTNTWDYVFGYLPPGNYTLAFACDTEDDDPIDNDGLTIPLPEGQVLEVSLDDGEVVRCDFREEADPQC